MEGKKREKGIGRNLRGKEETNEGIRGREDGGTENMSRKKIEQKNG